MGEAVRALHPAARVTSLDLIPWHLEAASHPKVAADAFSLPFGDASFDFVFSSLFLHHFQDRQVQALFREFGRVARRAVLVIDLERHPVPYYFVPWTRWLFGWDRVTCHDASISVEAAFRKDELLALAAQAGLSAPDARTFHPGFRIALWAGSPHN